MTNPLYSYDHLPPYQDIRPEHVQPAVDSLIEECEALLEKHATSESSCDWQHTMQPLEHIQYRLHQVWSPVSHLMGVASSDELRKAQAKAQPKIVAFRLKLAQDKRIFKKIEQLKDSAAYGSLTQSQKRVVEKKLQQAKNSGIELEGEAQLQFNKISQRLSELATDFSNNVLDCTKEYGYLVKDPKALAEVPQTYKDLWAERYLKSQGKTGEPSSEGPWLIGLDAPSYSPCMKFVADRTIRFEVYKAFMQRASELPYDNRPVISEILKLRQEMAELLSYNDYAELVLSEKMAKNADSVVKLLDDLHQHAYPAAEKELKGIASHARDCKLTGPLEAWDVAFYKEKYKTHRYSFSEEALRPYFQFEKVLSGLLTLCEDLFQIEITKRKQQPQVWDDSVAFYDINNKSGQTIAGFFLDPYARPATKRGGAWMDDCTARLHFKGELRLPVAQLVCNSAEGSSKQPSLLNFREVQDLVPRVRPWPAAHAD